LQRLFKDAIQTFMQRMRCIVDRHKNTYFYDFFSAHAIEDANR
jgi:hypothetical protein